jgi:hypothetical protein
MTDLEEEAARKVRAASRAWAEAYPWREEELLLLSYLASELNRGRPDARCAMSPLEG